MIIADTPTEPPSVRQPRDLMDWSPNVTMHDDLVKKAAFHGLTDHAWDLLTSPPHIVAFYNRANVLSQKLYSQIEEYHDKERAGDEVDYEWKKRTSSLWNKVNVLKVYLKPIATTQLAYTRERVLELETAIREHYAGKTNPIEQADRDLWAHVAAS